MKADYKKWMPQGMINGFAAATAVCWLVFWLVNNVGLIIVQTLRTLKKGGTFAIHDIMSKGKYGDMQLFAKQLNDMGYEKVQLIDTTNGKFMSKWEATWMGLPGSTLLVGRK